MADFDKAIKKVLRHEGGLVNDKIDPGGITNYGVSIRFLRSTGNLDYDFDGDGDIDCDDIKCMTVADAMRVYKECWWDKYGYYRIESDLIATKLFDTAINMGQQQAVKLIQRCLNIQDDGIMGAETIHAINNIDSTNLIASMRSACANFYLSLIVKNPKLIRFKGGWLARANT